MRKNILALLVAGMVAFAGSASAAEVSDNLDLQAEVFNECSISVQDSYTDMGGLNVEFSRANAGVLTVQCNLDAAYTIEMEDTGQHFGLGAGIGSENRRALWDGESEYLSYEIYQSEDFGLFWGEAGRAVAGVGTGNIQQLFYHLRFFNANLVSDGMYSDTVPVTLTYY